MKKYYIVISFVMLSVAAALGQGDIYVGTDYKLNIQRQGSNADAFIFHNAKYNNTTGTYQWATTHPSFGSRGIQMGYYTGITFYANSVPTTANSNFSPVPRFFIGNDGNVGIGTTSPSTTLDVIGGISIQNNNNLTWGGAFGAGIPTIAASSSTGLYFYPTGSTSGATMRIDADGKVGIGTSTPRGTFDVAGSGDIYLTNDPVNGAAQNLFLPGHIFLSPYSTSNISYIQARRADNSGTTSLRLRTYNNGTLTEAMHIEGNGNIGIGTQTPTEKLTVSGNILLPLQNTIGYLQSSDKFSYDGKNVGSYSLGWCFDSWNGGSPTGYLSAHAGLKIFTNNLPRLVVDNSGNVSIGTTDSKGYRLAVAGKSAMEDLIIKLYDNWPDYVFEPSCDLLPLDQLENYIQSKGHLPDVPTAETVKRDGYSVGQLDEVLLKKVEELTLYVIELKKENDRIVAELNAMKGTK